MWGPEGDAHHERLADAAPDEALRRREFLQRTALAAGLGIGAATTLAPDVLVAEAARRQRRVPLPSPRNMPVDTFVVLMMENRSFDHYLGWLPGADGRQAGLEYVDADGRAHRTARLAPDWQGCGHPDPDHSRKGGLVQLNGGRCDGFLRSGDNDQFAISYYEEGDLGFIQDAAKAYTAYDRFFCSLLASTLPNREYLHAAQSYGLMDNDLPFGADGLGFPDTSIFAALDRKGVSNQYFFVDVPVAALWGLPGLARSRPIAQFYAQAAAGTLPRVSFVDPFFAASAGEGPGFSGDEHPHGDVRAGQAFMADVVHAVMASPQWPRTAIFITYDEWGGFFDHVAPPKVPDQRRSADPMEDFRQMGFRIPTVAISPYARQGHVSHTVYGFESILKMIEFRFGVPPLTLRDRYANNIARSFDWEGKPRLEPAPLPDPATVVSLPCPGNADGPAARAKEHDLVELATSGYLERLGFDFRRARAEDAFRQPDTVRRGLAVR
ncbi:alkaline phosphatase family protein [Conexibacter sp. SYSU D00693]|uniref:alkaline phosphatase family protein n=1 Tax=Conexibacter sp. SYSU D00693 TaxID=2812560 RepID=UPI00196AE7DB|nr:alkaline phosphatase family protein [Conexibacter sp. SYSU D00693]